MAKQTASHQPESGPKGPRTAKITGTPLKTPLGSFQELAGYFHRHAVG
jgi:hypothetical protein